MFMVDFSIPFQFHYGTIRSLLLYIFVSFLFKFQFHYGTIRRHPKCLNILQWMYFNSTMVRFRRIV